MKEKKDQMKCVLCCLCILMFYVYFYYFYFGGKFKSPKFNLIII